MADDENCGLNPREYRNSTQLIYTFVTCFGYFVSVGQGEKTDIFCIKSSIFGRWKIIQWGIILCTIQTRDCIFSIFVHWILKRLWPLSLMGFQLRALLNFVDTKFCNVEKLLAGRGRGCHYADRFHPVKVWWIYACPLHTFHTDCRHSYSKSLSSMMRAAIP